MCCMHSLGFHVLDHSDECEVGAEVVQGVGYLSLV